MKYHTRTSLESKEISHSGVAKLRLKRSEYGGWDAFLPFLNEKITFNW